MNLEKQKPALSGVEWVVPELRFPEFENVGEWEIKKLEDFCDVNPTSKELPKKFVYVDLESVEKGRLLKRNILRLEDAPSRAQRLLQKNDVIFQMVRPYQNNNFFFDIDDEFEYVASTGYALLRAYKSELFLYQYLHTTDFVNRVLAKCTGSNYPAINSKDLSGIRVTVPKNPKEQQKIANCLSSLDEVITAETEKLDLLQNHKKGLLQQLFPAIGETKPKFRFPEFKNDGDWVISSLSKISSSIFDGTHQTPKYTDKGIPFFSVENIISGRKNKFISREDYLYETRNNKPEFGDVLITRIGNIGSPKVVDWNYEFSVYVTLAVVKKSKKFDSYYLKAYIQSSRFQNEILRRSLLEAAPCKINMDELRKCEVLLPSDKKEQQKIANCLSSADDLIESQTQKIKGLKKHKKGLMQQLFPTVNP